jgi:hypothetical protein
LGVGCDEKHQARGGLDCAWPCCSLLAAWAGWVVCRF